MAAGEGLDPSTHVNVKLAPGIERAHAEDILKDAPGVRTVVQLFPDERDDEMLGIYMLEVDSKSVDAAVQRLESTPEVEFAHETASRKLIW